MIMKQKSSSKLWTLFCYHIQISQRIVEHLKHFWQEPHCNMWFAFCCSASGFNSNDFLNTRIISKKCAFFLVFGFFVSHQDEFRWKITSKNIKAISRAFEMSSMDKMVVDCRIFGDHLCGKHDEH